MFVIEKGRVELSIYDLDGNKAIIAELGPGAYFGQVEIFTNGLRLTNAYVHPRTRLISLTAEVIKRHLHENSDDALDLIRDLCIFIDKGVEKIEDALILNAYQKICKKIFELSKQNETKSLQINQKRISEFLAISEKTTNVSLQKLREKGVVRMRRSFIQIIDDEQLEQEFKTRNAA